MKFLKIMRMVFGVIGSIFKVGGFRSPPVYMSVEKTCQKYWNPLLEERASVSNPPFSGESNVMCNFF